MNPYFVKLSNGSYLNLSQVVMVTVVKQAMGTTLLLKLTAPLYEGDTLQRETIYNGSDVRDILAALDKLASITAS